MSVGVEIITASLGEEGSQIDRRLEIRDPRGSNWKAAEPHDITTVTGKDSLFSSLWKH